MSQAYFRNKIINAEISNKVYVFHSSIPTVKRCFQVNIYVLLKFILLDGLKRTRENLQTEQLDKEIKTSLLSNEYEMKEDLITILDS